MPDDSLQAVAEQSLAAMQSFVADTVAMDRAWINGTYQTWLDEKLAAEREAFNATADGANSGQ